MLDILLFIIATYLGLSILYQFLLALSSLSAKKLEIKIPRGYSKILVLVPAYKEDEVILNSTYRNMLARFDYPKSYFDIVVIADQLKEVTQHKLRQYGAKVHVVKFDKSTKVKSLQSALQKYNKGYDGVVILDADNIMHAGFLPKANQLLQSGYRVVQGLRKAANEQNTIALLDGLSEHANTKMLCQGANRMGLSSKLSGSGMLFHFDLFKSVITQCKAVGGFDKELELKLTYMKEFIQFTPLLVVEDQKVCSQEAFTKQRGRWIEAQFSFFHQYFFGSIRQLLLGNFDHFHKVMQLGLPPRAVAPIVALIMLLLATITGEYLWVAIFALILFTTAWTYMIILPKTFSRDQLKTLLPGLPRIGWAAIRSLLLFKQSKKEFLHTPHQMIEV